MAPLCTALHRGGEAGQPTLIKKDRCQNVGNKQGDNCKGHQCFSCAQSVTDKHNIFIIVNSEAVSARFLQFYWNSQLLVSSSGDCINVGMS